jgi:hypothetical protein
MSASAIGFKGIVELVEDVGGAAYLMRENTYPEDEDLLVLAVEPTTDGDALRAAIDERGARTTLIILPKWIVMPDPGHKGWVRSLGRMESFEALSALPGKLKVSARQDDKGGELAIGHALLDGVTLRAPPQSQTVSGEGITPLLAVPGQGALLARIGDGQLYVLADPDIMNNQGLKDRERARAALKILSGLNSTDAESVMFDITLNGFGRKPSIFKLPFEPPFLSLTLALVVAALLAGLHGAFRFGPEAHEGRAISFGKAALVENSAGLIQLARREHRAGPGYVDLIREAAMVSTGVPSTLRGAELDAYFDRLSPAEAPKFSVLAERAQQASDSHELVSAARALFAWKKEYAQ